MITTFRTLKIMAALIWYIGGIILLSKGVILLIKADMLEPEQNWVINDNYFFPVTTIKIPVFQ